MAVAETPPNADSKFIIANLRGDEFRGFSMVNDEFVPPGSVGGGGRRED